MTCLEDRPSLLLPLPLPQCWSALPLTQFHRSVAVGAAIYSSSKKLMTDKTLRLYRNSPEDRDH